MWGIGMSSETEETDPKQLDADDIESAPLDNPTAPDPFACSGCEGGSNPAQRCGGCGVQP